MLEEYREKRDFLKTAEPVGENRPQDGGNIFCVQRHLATREHYDLRLEYDGRLLSWAVPKGVPTAAAQKRLAVKVEDHPIEYADFEGTIPKGQYGGGTVQLWDIGKYEAAEDFTEGLEKSSLKIILYGKRLRGRWALVRTDGDNWLLIKERDSQAGENARFYTTSVKSGRTTDEIAGGIDLTTRKNPFSSASPQLAVKADKLPEGGDWLYEIKYDGYRALTFSENGRVRISSRNGKDFTDRFSSVAEAVREMSLERAFVLDGEIIALKNGRTDFGALHGGATVKYAVFDVLALNGEDLRGLPYCERRRFLEELIPPHGETLMLSETAPAENGGEVMKAAARLKLEGMMAKRKDSQYTQERSEDWVKVKCRPRREFVIGGYTESDSYDGISSLLIGAFDGDKLVYLGKVGSGFSEYERKNILNLLAKETSKSPSFSQVPKSSVKGAKWVNPKHAAEIEYAEITSDGVLRQASFKGLRDDIDAQQVRLNEESDGEEKETGEKLCGVKLTSPERTVYNAPKKITKIEVARYYEVAAERMLPFLKDRAVAVVRCHDTAESGGFFKKHATTKLESTVTVKEDGEEKELIAVDGAAALMRQVQLGSLEFHVSGAKAASPDKLDFLVFDIDPDEGLDKTKVIVGAKDLKKLLESLGLVSFLKTSGGKGYHIVVPLSPAASREYAASFCKKVALLAEKQYPDRYTSNIRKAERAGKLFIDWQRNTKGATSVCPYSLRARRKAAVSLPIDWDGLDSSAPDFADIETAVKALNAPDPWRGFFDVKQTLKDGGGL